MNRAAHFAKEQPSVREFFGDICGTATSRATNSVGNTRLILTHQISTVRLRSSRSNWMAADITTVVGKCEIKGERSSSRTKELQSSDFGIINSRRTRQCAASNMVCARRANWPRSLTLILSLYERERKASRDAQTKPPLIAASGCLPRCHHSPGNGNHGAVRGREEDCF